MAGGFADETGAFAQAEVYSPEGGCLGRVKNAWIRVYELPFQPKTFLDNVYPKTTNICDYI
jgi:hypothetical protein